MKTPGRRGGAGVMAPSRLKARGLHLQIGFHVTVGRERFGVAEPKGDDLKRHAGLKQAHRTGMAEGVAGDPTVPQGRTVHGGLPNR